VGQFDFCRFILLAFLLTASPCRAALGQTSTTSAHLVFTGDLQKPPSLFSDDLCHFAVQQDDQGDDRPTLLISSGRAGNRVLPRVLVSVVLLSCADVRRDTGPSFPPSRLSPSRRGWIANASSEKQKCESEFSIRLGLACRARDASEMFSVLYKIQLLGQRFICGE
jgi:hypothetical protein